MPASRSRPPRIEPARRVLWPWILFGVLVVIAVILTALPAALLGRVLPPGVHADDFSGTVWHGSVGRVTYNGLDVGAVEWRLHPAALLGLSLAADAHWVKTSFVLDGEVNVSRAEFNARAVRGGGPIEDLTAFGVPPDWSGIATLNLSRLQFDFNDATPALKTAVGDLQVDNLASPRYTGGADIGGYRLLLADGKITADAGATAELSDLGGGPLDLHAVIRYLPQERRAMLSGTVRERGTLPPALHEQLQNLAQLRPRDAQGRLPLDLEFTF